MFPEAETEAPETEPVAETFPPAEIFPEVLTVEMFCKIVLSVLVVS